MTSDELKALECPTCQQPMSHGYIAGHWFRLRWLDRPTSKTIFSGEVMRKKISWVNSPSLEAVRCQGCKLGVFRFDY